MNPERDKEFDQNLNQLLGLLKKMLKNLPMPGGLSSASSHSPLPSPGKDGINLNLCFFTFLPLAPEDFDELDEIYDQHLAEEKYSEEIPLDLNPADLDFLRRNGIRF